MSCDVEGDILELSISRDLKRNGIALLKVLNFSAEHIQ